MTTMKTIAATTDRRECAPAADLLTEDALAAAVGGLSLHDFILPKVPPNKIPVMRPPRTL
jgi:hypothetical protein